MNDSHMRRHVSKGPSPQLAGTTSNEALHVERRAAFRQVYDMHGPVMRLKLNCFVLSKQVVLEGALRAAGLRQRRPDDLLARVLSRPPLEEDARRAVVCPLSSPRRHCRCARLARTTLPERVYGKLESPR